MATENKSYTALVGCNYPPGDQRAEPGQVIELPQDVARQLLALRAVAPTKAKTATGARSGAKPATALPPAPNEAPPAHTGSATAEEKSE